VGALGVRLRVDPVRLLIAKAATAATFAPRAREYRGTNVARVAGKPAAIATLVLDALKGLVPS